MPHLRRIRATSNEAAHEVFDGVRSAKGKNQTYSGDSAKETDLVGKDELLDLIQFGELRIEPIVAEAVGPCSIDLRLGLQYMIPTRQESLQHLELGEQVELPAGATLLFATLESISLPSYLIGWLHALSANARLGLLLQNSRIDPGFSGKLTLSIHNLSGKTVCLVSGLRIASVIFHRMSTKIGTSKHEVPSTTVVLDYLIDQGSAVPDAHFGDAYGPYRTFRTSGEYQGLIEVIRKIDARTTSGKAAEPEVLETLLKQINSPEATSSEKGRALEDLADNVLRSVSGLRIISRDARLAAEEIDFIVENCVDSLFWRNLGTPIIVECKNWSNPVGTPEITNLIGKMEALGPAAKFAFLVAINGITGDAHRDAQLRRREGRQKGRNIILLTREDLVRLALGSSFHHVLERRYDELLLI